MEVAMHDIPRFTVSERDKTSHRGYEPADLGETGAALWIAAAAIILILAGLSLFARNDVRNGGAPFVITPSSEIGAQSSRGF
jgi:hypothetical protein